MCQASSLGIMALLATGLSTGSCGAEALEVGIALQDVSGCHAASSSITWITGDLQLQKNSRGPEHQAFSTPLINHFGWATLKAAREPLTLAAAAELTN